MHAPSTGDLLGAGHAILFEHEPSRFFGASEVLADIGSAPNELVGIRDRVRFWFSQRDSAEARYAGTKPKASHSVASSSRQHPAVVKDRYGVSPLVP